MKLTEKNYIERDVSWMAFNYRILAEAQREDIPLMERLNYLGIYSNNLDKFFRVRVATLNRIVELADKSTKELQIILRVRFFALLRMTFPFEYNI